MPLQVADRVKHRCEARFARFAACFDQVDVDECPLRDRENSGFSIENLALFSTFDWVSSYKNCVVWK